MRISSSPWFESMAQELTSLDFDQLWADFLADPDVMYMSASATDDDYRRLFLQFLATRPEVIDNVIAKNSWLLDDTNAVYQQRLSRLPSHDELVATVSAFLTTPELFDLARSGSSTGYRLLYARFLVATFEADPASTYSAAIQAFMGPTSLEQRRTIILGFLLWPDLLEMPIASLTDDEYQQLFMRYLSSEQALVYRSQETTGLSPQAIEQSKVLWNVFDALAESIASTSVSQIRSNELIDLLIKRRQAYLDMMKKIPIYVGAGTTDIAINTWLNTQQFLVKTSKGESSLPSSADFVFTRVMTDPDPTKFTVGYGNINLQEISEWLYSQYAADPGAGASFTLYSGDNKDSNGHFVRQRLVLSLTRDGAGNPVARASLIKDTITGGVTWISQSNPFDTSDATRTIENTSTIEFGTADWAASGYSSTTLIDGTIAAPTGTDQNSLIGWLNNQFEDTWSQGLQAGYLVEEDPAKGGADYEQLIKNNDHSAYTIASINPKIQWQSGILTSKIWGTGSKQDIAALNTRSTTLRGTYNQRLSSYTSSIDTRMEALKNAADQQSQLIDAAMNGQKGTVSILQSVLQMIQQVLSSMFA